MRHKTRKRKQKQTRSHKGRSHKGRSHKGRSHKGRSHKGRSHKGGESKQNNAIIKIIEPDDKIHQELDRSLFIIMPHNKLMLDTATQTRNPTFRVNGKDLHGKDVTLECNMKIKGTDNQIYFINNIIITNSETYVAVRLSNGINADVNNIFFRIPDGVLLIEPDHLIKTPLIITYVTTYIVFSTACIMLPESVSITPDSTTRNKKGLPDSITFAILQKWRRNLISSSFAKHAIAVIL